MKKVLFSIAVLLAIPLASLAQTGQNSSNASAKKAHTLTGEVSNDRKTLVGSNDEVWTISNPAAVAGHEGQQVRLKCQLSADKSAIYVFVLKPMLAETKHVARLGDSAFRR